MIVVVLMERLRSAFQIVPPDPYGRATRVRIVVGVHAGREALFCEVRRMIVDGHFGPGRMLPIDIIDGPHVHLNFEDVEWLESPVKEWRAAL